MDFEKLPIPTNRGIPEIVIDFNNFGENLGLFEKRGLLQTDKKEIKVRVLTYLTTRY